MLRKLITDDLERLVQQQAALDRSAARLTPGSRPGGEGEEEPVMNLAASRWAADGEATELWCDGCDQVLLHVLTG